jgi:hypothetical protein
MSLHCFYKLGVITYFTLNQEYIATELCINKEKPAMACHGTCFLKKNLKLADEANDNNGATTGRTNLEFPLFIVSRITYTFYFVPRNSISNSRYAAPLSQAHLQAPFHPPSFCS